VADFGTSRVTRLGDDGRFADLVYYDRRVLEEPTAMRFAGDALWVVGDDTRNLVHVDVDGGELSSTVAGDGAIPWPLAVALDPAGQRAVVTAASAPVGERFPVWSLPTAERIDAFAGRELDHVRGIELGFRGGVYVNTTDAVVHYRPAAVIDGTPMGPVEPERVLTLPGVGRLEIGPDAALYAAAQGGLLRLDDDATGFEPVAGPELSIRSFAFLVHE